MKAPHTYAEYNRNSVKLFPSQIKDLYLRLQRCDEIIIEYKDKLHRRNMQIKDLKEQQLLTVKKGYQIKNLIIRRSEDSKIYDLEYEIFSAVEKVLKHRENRYDEDYWKEALPATLFTILDNYDKNAVMCAIKTMLKYLNR